MEARFSALRIILMSLVLISVRGLVNLRAYLVNCLLKNPSNSLDFLVPRLISEISIFRIKIMTISTSAVTQLQGNFSRMQFTTSSVEPSLSWRHARSIVKTFATFCASYSKYLATGLQPEANGSTSSSHKFLSLLFHATPCTVQVKLV
jgi:hypothetical protein